MKIIYKNTTVEKQFCSKYKKKWRYPEQVKKKLEAAENYMIHADSLMDIANYQPFPFDRRIKKLPPGSRSQNGSCAFN